MQVQTNLQNSMILSEGFDEATMFKKWFKLDGIMAWFIVTGAMLVALSIVAMALLESEIVNEAGAHNRQVAFLRIAEFMGDMIGKTGNIRDVTKLQELIQDVHEIRAGVKRLSVFEITPDSSSLVFSTDPKAVPPALDLRERTEVQAGRSVMQLDESSAERGWRITAPITIDGKVVGALRGLYSVKEYDDLVKQEMALSETIGIGVVIITAVVFLLLIRIKIHRPVQRLLIAMRNVESGNLSSDVSIEGPVEIKELTTQFNRMLSARRRAWAEKDRLLAEVRHFNERFKSGLRKRPRNCSKPTLNWSRRE